MRRTAETETNGLTTWILLVIHWADRAKTFTARISISFALYLVSVGLVVASLTPASNGVTHRGPLSLSQRIVAQRSIEEVYWRHRIWPNENKVPKPAFDKAVSKAEIEN